MARADCAWRILAVSTPPFAWRYLKARVDAYGRAKKEGMQIPFCKNRFQYSTIANRRVNDRLTRINLHRPGKKWHFRQRIWGLRR